MTNPMTESAQPSAPDQTSPDPINLLFGFRGRLGRRLYWVGIAIMVGLLIVVMMLAAMAMNPTGGGAVVLLAFPLLALAVWVHAAVTVKRLRDMGFSASLYPAVGVGLVVLMVIGIEAIETAGGLFLLVIVAILALPGIIERRPGGAAEARQE